MPPGWATPDHGATWSVDRLRQVIATSAQFKLIGALDDDGLFSDEVRARRLEFGPARAFVLGLRLREIVDERDREVVVAFFRTIAQDVHWTRFVENSPWRHDEDDLRRKVDALRSGFEAERGDAD